MYNIRSAATKRLNGEKIKNKKRRKRLNMFIKTYLHATISHGFLFMPRIERCRDRYMDRYFYSINCAAEGHL